jgi:hypothetical protein
MERHEISKKTSLVFPIVLGRCTYSKARIGPEKKSPDACSVSMSQKTFIFFGILGAVPKPKKDGKGGCSLNDTDQDRVKRI